jgi:ubiquinone biosynthesis monooxygenase Coq7
MPSTTRSYSWCDQLILQVDLALQTLSTSERPSSRPYPAEHEEVGCLTDKDRQHVSGLMRVNHTGEVCAQALYSGQALTARLDQVRLQMEEAAAEEEDHLAWCEQRLRELASQPSVTNPLWYSLSFVLGAIAGACGDRYSLGFVAETEHQVTAHLQSHLKAIPREDTRTRTILHAMAEDEAKHAKTALDAGGIELPGPVKRAMAFLSKVMTKTVYYF